LSSLPEALYCILDSELTNIDLATAVQVEIRVEESLLSRTGPHVHPDLMT
jgi:hypothetical protein